MKRLPLRARITIAGLAVALLAALALVGARYVVPQVLSASPAYERAEVERYSAQLSALDAQYREYFRAYRRDQQATAAEVATAIEAASTTEDRSRVLQALRRVQGLEKYPAHERNLREVRDRLNALPLPSSPALRRVVVGYLTAYNTAVLSASAMSAFPQLWQDSTIRIAATYATESDSAWRQARQQLSALEAKYNLPVTEPSEPRPGVRTTSGRAP